MVRHFYHDIKDNIERIFREKLRSKQDKADRSRLTNTDFSVISSNCVGAVMLHNLGQRFNSPTVNLFIKPADYLKFLKNLDHYLGCGIVGDPAESKKVGYPVGYCDDIKIYFMHYKTIEEADQKWKQRSKRVNKDNLYVIMVDRDGCSEEIMQEFDRLPYKNKVFLSGIDHPEISCSVLIPEALEPSENGCQTTDLCKYQPGFTGLRLFDEWDYVEFLNKR